MNTERAGGEVPFPFLEGGGAVGELLRSHDWTQSPLGLPETWPQSLRSVVGLLLTSKFPMFVAWGPELGFLYNDAYAEILGGKHPAALGRRFQDIWSELWSELEPMISAALRGEATYHENLPLVLNRRGFPEQAWFTFSYSPVRNELGEVAGMFCAVAETSTYMRAQARQGFRLQLEERLHDLADPASVMAAAAEATGRALGVARVGYGEIDESQTMIVIDRDWTDGTVSSLAGRLRLDDFGPALIDELRAGRTVLIEDSATDGRTETADAAFKDIESRSAIGVPLVKSGRLTAVLFLHHSAPRQWHEDEVRLVEEVADRTWAAVVQARAEAKLRETQEQFEVLVENLPSLAWSAGSEGEINFYNRRWYEYTGTTFEQMQELGWETVLEPQVVADVMDRWKHSLATGTPFEMEFPLRGADGVFRWFLTRGQPLRNARGEVIRWFATSTNIDEQRRQAAALKVAVEARDTFLSVAGHELKTPLTPLTLRLHSLVRAAQRQAKSPFVEQVQLFADNAQKQIDKLTDLVNDLLDVSRISAGRFRMELEPTDLSSMVKEVVARFEPEAQKAGSIIDVRVPAALIARTSGARLEQVVTNLVDNAIKYGAGKPIMIALSQQEDRAQLRVTDGGIGILPEHLSRIFERFERAVSDRHYGGLGLGLYISRTIVESLGGTISVQSEPGRGAAFTVSIPLEPSAAFSAFRP